MKNPLSKKEAEKIVWIIDDYNTDLLYPRLIHSGIEVNIMRFKNKLNINLSEYSKEIGSFLVAILDYMEFKLYD